jgi:hypothetical protein
VREKVRALRDDEIDSDGVHVPDCACATDADAESERVADAEATP